jgi:hypothetical protein
MVYPAIKGRSKKGTHPLLVYPSPTEDGRYYKFGHKKTNNDSFSYRCMGCQSAYDNKHANVVVKSIKVSADYSEFLTDPEDVHLQHSCGNLGYTFDQLDVEIQQIYRYVFRNASPLHFIFYNSNHLHRMSSAVHGEELYKDFFFLILPIITLFEKSQIFRRNFKQNEKADQRRSIKYAFT